MSDETLVRHCSPTLAGIKSGNLFSENYPDRESMIKDIRHFNQILVPHGLALLPLQYKAGWTLLYLYRPEELKKDLSSQEAEGLLEQIGYSESGIGGKISHLIRRLNQNPKFPHEIGLFLSYPPEDVKGFIRNQAKGFKCTGFWKVYGDEQKAQKTFFRYHRCTDSYLKHLENGATLEQLILD